MATFEVDGLSAFQISLDKMAETPKTVKEMMLEAGAEILARAQRESAETHGLRRTGMLIDSIIPGRPRLTADGGFIGIAPEGTRVRGRTVTRNAEIAYVNEYGKKGTAGTEFIKKANSAATADAVLAAAKIYHEWLVMIGLR